MFTSLQASRAPGLWSTLGFVATMAAGAALAIATPVANAGHSSSQAALPLLALVGTSSECPCNTGLVGGPDSTPVVETSSTPLAVPSQKETGGKVTVRITGANDNGDRVTDGGVGGTGRFTASGAITDEGTCVAYRTVKGAFITLRFVTVGTKGTITFVVKIDTDLGTSRWTISSGTKAYKGLHGKGIERENIDYTVSTLTGTVSR
jgi:hypothetical protein